MADDKQENQTPKTDADAEKPKKETKIELKFATRPDKTEKETKLADIDGKIAELVRVRTSQEASLKELKEKTQPGRAVLEKLRNEIRVLNDKKNAIVRERDSLRARQDKTRQQQKSKREELRKFRASLKYSKLEDVDAEINRLEQYQSTVSLALKDEKDLIKQISSLRQERKKIEELKKLAGDSAEEGADDKTDLNEALKAKNLEINKLFDELNAKRDERKAISERKDNDSEKMNKVYNQVTKTREKVNELYAQKKAILTEWKKKNDEYYNYQRALQAERKKQEQERFEEERKRREEEAKKREEEEMKKKPWTEEIALCDFLVGYLEKLLPAEEDTISPAALEAASSTGVVHEGFEDLKLATRKKEIVDDFMVMGGGKPKKNKKKVKKKDDRLTHSVDFLSSFELLSLEAPMKVTDIPASIEQLNEKRAYYDVLPRAPKKGITESDEIEGSDVSNKKKPKVQKKKKASAPSVESSDLFPTLPGSKSPKTVPAAATNGPTAVDMVKSNGTATLNNGQIPPSSPTPAESLAMPTSSPVYSAE